MTTRSYEGLFPPLDWPPTPDVVVVDTKQGTVTLQGSKDLRSGLIVKSNPEGPFVAALRRVDEENRRLWRQYLEMIEDVYCTPDDWGGAKQW